MIKLIFDDVKNMITKENKNFGWLKANFQIFQLSIMNKSFFVTEHWWQGYSTGNFSAFDNEQLFWLLNIDDKEILNVVGKFINDIML